MKDPRETCFNGLAKSISDYYIDKAFKIQPGRTWELSNVDYGGWNDVSSVWLIAEEDKMLPADMQRQMAGMAGSKIETCTGCHMVMLSHPEKCVEVIRKAAGEDMQL